MKKKVLLTLLTIPALLMVSCGKNNPSYEVKSINVYREKGKVDKQIELRFYKTLPNVPYIGVSDYFKEFFKTDMTRAHLNIPMVGNQYVYANEYGAVLSFDVKNQSLYTNSLQSFNDHPDFISNTGKLFIDYEGGEATELEAASLDLSRYSIPIYAQKKEAYVPLSLLSSVTGGIALYDVAYNGKDLYVMDYNGQLGLETSSKYYGNSYFEELNDTSKTRPQDLIEYTYNELCFVFDNLRGYTKQLHFGDDNLLQLGLDGLLTQKHPIIKQYLLSENKVNYYEGLTALFNGLYDGGHTGIISSFDSLSNASLRESEQEFKELRSYVKGEQDNNSNLLSSFRASRLSKLLMPTLNNFYYYNDSTYKTSYIVFNNFTVDFEAWDNFYNGKGSVPVNTDTYAFVRKCMYQAKEDGAENIVLDITTNGGGSSYALEGILGLFNNATGYIKTLDVVNNYTVLAKHKIDINLDGVFDENDALEASKFNFKVGVLSSPYAFSCGNLFAFNMQELGYKIMGEKSGGGSCAISLDSTADGIQYVHSTYLCLTDEKGENIDGGVNVDYTIEKTLASQNLYDFSEFYNSERISTYLKSAY